MRQKQIITKERGRKSRKGSAGGRGNQELADQKKRRNNDGNACPQGTHNLIK